MWLASKRLSLVLLASVALFFQGCVSHLRGDHDHDPQRAIRDNSAGESKEQSLEPTRKLAMPHNSEKLFRISNNSDSGQSKLDDYASSVFAFWTSERIKTAVPKEFKRDKQSSAGNFTSDSAQLLQTKPLQNWTYGGEVQRVIGRILYCVEDDELDLKCYRCSGTSVTDNTDGRSIILTAAHCVYDPDDKKFTKFGIFIPNQDDGGSDQTDMDCNNDKYGCWALAFGVVDQGWVTTVNDRWGSIFQCTTVDSPFGLDCHYDYAFYVVNDTNAHQGTLAPDALDQAVGSLPISFDAPVIHREAYAFGYYYAADPFLQYCTDALQVKDDYWYVPRCTMGGSTSGGPWIQPMDITTGYGPIIGINSFHPTLVFYGNGEFSPRLNANAECLFIAAKSRNFGEAIHGGIIVNCRTPSNSPSRLPSRSPTNQPIANPSPSPTNQPIATPSPSTILACPENVGPLIALRWKGDDDLDLHVQPPCGDEIYYGNPAPIDVTGAFFEYGEGNTGGYSGYGDYVERARFSYQQTVGSGSTPAGKYSFWVENSVLKESPDTWTLEVYEGDQLVQSHSGSTADKSETYTYIRNVQRCQNSCSSTQGTYPGCRFIVRKAEKWTLPLQYHSVNFDQVQKGVCSTVAIPATDFFLETDVDTTRWILGDGNEGRISCSSSSVTYCVTSDWYIVKCGDLGCQKTTDKETDSKQNYCSYWIKQDRCDDSSYYNT
jgi:hypothetical protein